MRRLLATALSAAAVLAVPATANATHYDRTCGGVLDIQCEGWVCPTDCWRRDCVVWIDPLHDPNTAQCVSGLR